MIWSTALVFALTQVCLANPVSKRWEDVSVRHAWAAVPHGWELRGAAPADHSMSLRIGLKQGRMDELIQQLYEVSDPAHAKYGQHLSLEEVNALVAPHPDTLDAVNAWLAHHGVDTSACQRTGANDWVTIRVTVAQAERMLGTTYNVYRHSTTLQDVVRTLEYSLPDALEGHVDVVAPTTYFGTTRSMRTAIHSVTPVSDVAVPLTCSVAITPTCLQDLYNTAAYTPKATSTNKLGIVGYLEEYANRADLQAEGNYTTVLVNDGLDDQSDPGVEANLDVQYGASISYPTPVTYYSTGGSPPYTPDDNMASNTNEPYLDFLEYIGGQQSIPQTFTTSYGDTEQTVPMDYAISVCNGFATLGARGVSLVFSTGDNGVGEGDCMSNDGSNKAAFQPTFPVSCPYVTAVGATQNISPEVGAAFSSGGFSNYFSTPAYQANVTAAFIESLGTTYAGLYNASGRGTPDVSAQGSNFHITVGGQDQLASGTSASAPTFAAIIALLNDYRISAGQAPLGFLNPFLYASGAAGLTDIIAGSNPGCETTGFTARAGWDPVTGLGTPDFGKLQALV
ncbi:subtilisin-like protein [Athelia psychrophila]|uniref:tripeptidyl-peptidase II n=1 Tax=Athelia psychrophila TaxID=1759441 RepID=A0A166CKM3_9AGAM|nr:subtilisin-like protein [Fibularhizoctonia sp. CBS 109695]